MPLRLLVGPANAGKVARLLDQYVRWLDEEPCLVVPNRGEVDRIEREILRRSPGVVGGWIGTFDDLFEQIAAPLGHGAVVSAPQRRLLLRRVSAAQPLNGLGRSARSDGFTDALAEAVREVESALVEPASLAAELAALVSSYRAGLLRVGLEDREGLQRIAVTRLQSDLDAWDRRPIVAYGFEDLTAAQWALLEGLSARAEVVVSLPYEPGRRVFEAVRPTADDLMRLASDVEELPPGDWGQADALAHLERSLFELPRASTPPLGGAVRFLEASGTRASLELVAEEILHLIASGTAPEAITVVCPDIERIRRSFELAFGAFGVPFVVDSGERLTRTSFGRALIALLRFAWQEGERSDLFAFLRSRFSGIGRSRVDFVEGRLRGRAVRKRDRVEAETTRLLEGPLELLDALRAGTDPVTAVRELAHAMMTAAWNPVAPSPSDQLGHDLLAHETVETVLGELAHWRELDQAVEPNDLVAALERARQPAPRAGRGRIVLTDLLRARTRRTEALVVVGLEEGVLPRRGSESPFLPDEERRRIDTATPRARLVRPDVLARDRYLFYAACTRARSTLVLVREAATDDGRPREASPFWHEVRSHFAPADVERATRRRGLASLAWRLEEAPTERERLRSVAATAAVDAAGARSLAAANGWARRIDRALDAFSRSPRLSSAANRAALAATTTFSVTDLEVFGDCSSLWFIDRQIRPRDIDAEVDPRMRGSVAHQALHRFYSGMPRELGVDVVGAAELDGAIVFMKQCLKEAIESQVWIELDEVEELELQGRLGRDLEQFLRREVELALPLVPRRLEVAFGSERAPPELQRGLALDDFAVSGKIDRIDLDPFSARGIVQDYKSGSAHSAARIDADGRLQIPLYALALRDLIGVEPVGALYRSLSGKREARGILRADEADLVPGLARRDYLDEDEFWEVVERAKGRAVDAVGRIRQGDVRHDPRAGECPAWCDRWPMCRVERA